MNFLEYLNTLGEKLALNLDTDNKTEKEIDKTSDRYLKLKHLFGDNEELINKLY